MIKGGDNNSDKSKKNNTKLSYANVAKGKSYKNIAKTAGIKLKFVENGKNPFLLEYPYSKYRDKNKITNVLVYNPIYDGLEIQWEKTPRYRRNINERSHIPNKKKFIYLCKNWDAATEIIKGGKNKVINELTNAETNDIKKLLENLISGELYEERAIILHKWLGKHGMDVVDSKYITRAGTQGTFLTPLYQLWYKLYTKLSRPKKSVKKTSVKNKSISKSNNNSFYNNSGVGINSAKKSNNNQYNNSKKIENLVQEKAKELWEKELKWREKKKEEKIKTKWVNIKDSNDWNNINNVLKSKEIENYRKELLNKNKK